MIVKYIDIVSRYTPLLFEIKIQKKTKKFHKYALRRATTSRIFFPRDRAKFFQISIPLPIPSKFSKKRMSPFLCLFVCL